MRGFGRVQVPGSAPSATRSFTPAVTQSGEPTYTSRSGFFTRIPGTRFIIGYATMKIAATSGAVANNYVIPTLPVSPSANYNTTGYTRPIGVADLYDASAFSGYVCELAIASGSVFLVATGTAAETYIGITGAPFAAALAANDLISYSFMYEAAT